MQQSVRHFQHEACMQACKAASHFEGLEVADETMLHLEKPSRDCCSEKAASKSLPVPSTLGLQMSVKGGLPWHCALHGCMSYSDLSVMAI